MNTIQDTSQRVKDYTNKAIQHLEPNGKSPLFKMEKAYPKFPKNKKEFHKMLDEEHRRGELAGDSKGFKAGMSWAETTQARKRQETLRRASEVALDCLETVRHRLDIRDYAASNSLNQAQTETTASLAKMMYSTFKILELQK